MIIKEKDCIVEFDARRNLVNLYHSRSVLCGETIDAAMEDPKMEAIFANTEVENYLDCIIRLVLEKNQEICELKKKTEFLDNTAGTLAEEGSNLLRAYKESRRRVEELERELKHIATQAGRAVHK